ncbi:hypothetical protein [Spirosoma aerophilum]
MDAILLVIVLLIPLIWFSTEKIQANRKVVDTPGDYMGFTFDSPTGNNTDNPETDTISQSSNKHAPDYTGRLYYSIPGRSFIGYIYNGRILRRK